MPYKRPRKYDRVRKSNGKCERCGEKFPESELHSYVDESNAAITYNSPYYCGKCYRIVYGKGE